MHKAKTQTGITKFSYVFAACLELVLAELVHDL